MIKQLRYLCTLLLMAVASVAWGDEVTFSPSEFDAVSSQKFSLEKSGITISCSNGTITSTQFRIFKSQTLKISSSEQIEKIVITCTASGTAQYGPGCFAAIDGYSYDGEIGTWTGSAKEVTFTASSNQVRATSIVVTYSSASTNQVATPSISGTTPFYASTDVAISCGTDGASIQYSTDGTTWSDYSEPFTITETTTVQAKATKDGLTESEVASKTFTKGAVLDNIATLSTQTEAGTYFVTLANAVVTYVNGNYAYIEDASGAIVMYKSNHGLNAGDILTGTAEVVYQVRNGNPQITALSGVEPTSGTAPEATTIAASSWSTPINTVLSKYFKVTGATITLEDSKYYTQLGEENVQLYGQGDAKNFTLADLSVTYTLVGFPTVYNSTPELQIFVVPEAESTTRKAVIMAFDPALVSVTLNGDFVAPELTVKDEDGEVLTDLAISYSSSNPTVATVDTETGEVDIKAIGTAEITATFAGNETYVENSASYTLNVVDGDAPGATSDNPYTVAEARAAIDAGTGVTGVYVKGIVSKIVTAYNSQYGNISYNISADGTEEADQLQAYRGKSYNGENFTSADDIQVGDEVVVYGNLKNYNDTYEFDAGNQLVSLNRPETPVVLPVPTFSPAAGEVVAGTTVTINIPEDENVDDVEYSFDQNTWEPYKEGFTFTINEETTIYARSVGTDGSYSEVASATYTIKAETVAVLPFEWAGGASADLLALDGVSADGLGTDYAESNAPYRVKFDTTDDYIQVKTDSQPGKVTIGVKMLGGANTSTITVQQSSDGETFTDVQELTISGAQNDILTLETTNAFAADSRYVRLTFTKGSNVGVGPITISKPATEIVAEETLEIDARATSGEIAYSIAYPETGVALTAAADVDWISDVTVASDKVTFTITVNTGAERSGNITLTYGTLTKVVKVTQAAAPQMYTLTIGNPENVTISATYNVDQVINNGESAELENGTEVTFALTIPEGYALENVTVAGEEEGQTVELTENATTPGVYTFTMPAFNVTINATVAKIETTTYTLATSVTPGKRYIIVGVNENTYKAMGEQKSNNRAAVEISVNDKTATVPSTAGAYEFVIDGNATDGYTIYDEVTPGYLYAAGGTKNNYLKTEEVPDESGNGTWTIEFDAEAKSAIIKSKNTEDNMRNWIRFNNSSSLFSCYASGQEDVYLYEKEVKGDVNKDGHITIADVTALVNIILGKVTAENNPDNYNFDAADVNNDGSPTIADVTELVNIILGKTN